MEDKISERAELNKASQAELSEAQTRIADLEATIESSKAELASVEAANAKDKITMDDLRAKVQYPLHVFFSLTCL